MKKLKLYLDTSVFSFVFADDELQKRESTNNFFDKLSKFNCEIFISETVIVEVSRSEEPLQTKLRELISKHRPTLLTIDEEVKMLAKRYVEEGLIPEKYQEDAHHIAIAVVNELDVIVSWNLDHIVKMKTKIGVNGINKFLGYKEIEIFTPEEVF